MEYMEKWMRTAVPMEAVPAVEKPSLEGSRDLRAVVFDIYGTLIMSASGDIKESEFSSENLKRSLDDSDIILKEEYRRKENEILLELMSEYVRTVHFSLGKSKSSGIMFPEIVTEEIWEAIMNSHKNRPRFSFGDGFSDFKRLAFVFEFLSNRVYPMKALKETLEYLHMRGIPMGIISNAQFYTPIIMNYFISGNVTDSDRIDLFDPDLIIFSYKMKRSKPDPLLFETVSKTLKNKYSIMPENTIFVGNDMYKDIYPACKAGFSTALFAGDIRSCKLRKEKEETRDLKPDYILTEVAQIIKILEGK